MVKYHHNGEWWKVQETIGPIHSAQHSNAQQSGAEHSKAQHSIAKLSSAQHSIAQLGTAQHCPLAE